MHKVTGLSSLGVPGVPWQTQILADQLTIFQPGGTDYAHLTTNDTPGFSDLPTALSYKKMYRFDSRGTAIGKTGAKTRPYPMVS